MFKFFDDYIYIVILNLVLFIIYVCSCFSCCYMTNISLITSIYLNVRLKFSDDYIYIDEYKIFSTLFCLLSIYLFMLLLADGFIYCQFLTWFLLPCIFNFSYFCRSVVTWKGCPCLNLLLRILHTKYLHAINCTCIESFIKKLCLYLI